jgi:hypothetical protein
MNCTIFLSYCWSNKEQANEIDTDFAQEGLTLKRDIRDLEYKQSLKEFMKGIRKTDLVIMVISNEYLRSKNCMFEVLEVIKDEEYKNRIFPIILPDTEIYDDMKSLQFYEHWSIKYKELESRVSGMPPCDIGHYGKELKILQDIKGTINEFIALLKEWMITPYEDLSKDNFAEVRSKMPLPKVKDNIPANLGESILEQTYGALKRMHRDINFYPIHLLQNEYPFRVSKKGYTHYSSFSLETDNEDLVRLLQLIEQGESAYDNNIKKTLNYPEKITFICEALAKNYIGSLTANNRRNKVFIGAINPKVDDIHNLYDSYQFKHCIEKLETDSEDHKQLIKHAYVAYKLGNYLLSARYQKRAYDIAFAKGHKLGAFIAIYNLRNLDHYLYNEHCQEGIELYRFARDIDIKEECKKLKTIDNEAVINWIINNMYSGTSENILEITRKITDHYYTFKNGGSSNNGFIDALTSRYLKFLAFINLNHIIYEHYAEYSNINTIYFEGAIASHAITDKGGSNLEFFSNLMVINLIDGGSRDKVLKYIKRYELDTINYDYSADNQYAVEAIKNFFTSTKDIVTQGIKVTKGFWDRQNEILANILTYAALSNISDDLIELICENLLYALENKLPITRLRVENLRDFVGRLDKRINSSYLLRLVAVLMSDKEYLEKYTNLFTLIAKAFKSQNQTIRINHNQYDLLLNLIKGYFKGERTRFKIDKFYELLLCLEQNEYKDQIKRTISEGIFKKFEFDTCYLAVIYGVIELQDELLEKLINSISSIKRRNDKNRLGLFSHREDRSYAFDQFINLCFKEEINTTGERFRFIREFDTYYKWLLDIESFDYRIFDPDWITENATKFYFKRFNKSKLLRNELEESLKKKFNTSVSEAYIGIYISEVWK